MMQQFYHQKLTSTRKHDPLESLEIPQQVRAPLGWSSLQYFFYLMLFKPIQLKIFWVQTL